MPLACNKIFIHKKPTITWQNRQLIQPTHLQDYRKCVILYVYIMVFYIKT